MILQSAFQFGAFQFTAFQERTRGGGGGWTRFWQAMLRAERKRLAAIEAKRKKEKAEEEEAVAELVALRFVAVNAQAPEFDLAKQMYAILRIKAIDEDAELREFAEMWSMLEKIAEACH